MKKALKVSGISLLVGGALLILMMTLSGDARADNITVTTTADAVDADTSCGAVSISELPGPDGVTSLREAVCAADNTAGSDSITFELGGVYTLTQGTLMMANTVNGGNTTIDGDLDDDGSPDVEIRWQSGTVNAGLIRVRTPNNTFEGLAITNSPRDGIYVDGVGYDANETQIINCWLGLDLNGDVYGNTRNGVKFIHAGDPAFNSGATQALIQDSVASGNGSSGIYLQTSPSTEQITGTQILSTYVGLDPTGALTLANGSTGIYVSRAYDTMIEGSVIAANGRSGVYVTSTHALTVSNSIVGLTASGGAAGNSQYGLSIAGGSSDLLITNNTVSANTRQGILLGSGVNHVSITGNRIGTDPSGTSGMGNGRTTDDDGIQINNAYHVTIGGPMPADGNIIAHNGRAGIFITGEHADDNTVQNNTIGAGVGDQDLGNGDYPLTHGSGYDTGSGGIYVYDGADNSLIQDNRIVYNYIGVRLSGGNAAQVTPPQANQVLSNTISFNDHYGVVNQTTHRNTGSDVTPTGGDNLIQQNTITGTENLCDWCSGLAIYNVGASPRIVSNTIASNKSIGITNIPYFGTDGPADASDDLLSMPYIAGNTVSGNDGDGIQSIDTAPTNKETLLEDNTFVNNFGNPHISQRWFAAVEVISGTESLDSGILVTITRSSGDYACATGACQGNSHAAAGSGDGIWGSTGVSYDNVYTDDPDDPTTWFEVVEYTVDWLNGDVVTYTPHLVRAGGAEEGAQYYALDGITTTDEIDGDTHLPHCIPTGILNDPDHTLCRYQIAQIDVFGSFGDGDWDDDGISDDEEGNDDADGDGTPNYQDTDSDDDGIPDSEEGTTDTDGDGTPDFLDDDSDDDGIGDEVEGNVDTDGDGTDDYRDDDSDGDGIGDDEEAKCSTGGTTNPDGVCDTDGDGTPDYTDYDSDNDGVTDNAEGNGDTDGDGIPNYRDTDSDDDGLPDASDPDDDNDGISDVDEGLVDHPDNDYGNLDESTDTDGDGTPDYLDTDSDDDGLLDADEGNVDTDGDGTPDFQDTDSDDDGTEDGDEWYDDSDPNDTFCSDTTVDTDGDGTPNCQDNDADGDGIPNYQDTDSDGDGIPDSQESRTDPDPSPVNRDIPAWLDPIRYIHLPLVMKGH